MWRKNRMMKMTKAGLREKSRRLSVGIIVIAVTAVVLAGAVKEEISFIYSVNTADGWNYRVVISDSMKSPTGY